MRLDPLAEFALAYRDLLVVSPFGGDDGAAYGGGDGTATGERLSGSVRWTNHPKRRSDGVFLPDVHGIVETADGANVLFHIRGRTRLGEDAGLQNLVFTFESEDESYRWLNQEVCVGEGVIDRATATMRIQVYVCVNQLR